MSLQTIHTSYRGLGFLCRHGTTVPLYSLSWYELLYIPEYSRVKHKPICLTAKAWQKLGHETWGQSPAHSRVYNRMSERETKNWSPDLNSTEMLWQDFKGAVHERVPTNFNGLTQDWKEKWSKVPTHSNVSLLMSRRKHQNQATVPQATEWLLTLLIRNDTIISHVLLFICVFSFLSYP